MIDAINLLFAHHLEQAIVQLHRTGQIGAERLLDHHATKSVFGFLQQTGRPQTRRHFTEEARCRSKIEHRVGRAGALYLAFDVQISGVIQEIALHITDSLGKLAPQFGVQRILARLGDLRGRFVTNEVFKLLRKIGVADRVVIDTDNVQARVNQTVTRQIVERRHQQAFDKVPVRTE